MVQVQKEPRDCFAGANLRNRVSPRGRPRLQIVQVDAGPDSVDRSNPPLCHCYEVPEGPIPVNEGMYLEMHVESLLSCMAYSLLEGYWALRGHALELLDLRNWRGQIPNSCFHNLCDSRMTFPQIGGSLL